MAKKKVKKRSNRYPVGFQRDAVERMKHCEDIGKLAEELGVSRGALYLWKRKAEGLLSYRDAARRAIRRQQTTHRRRRSANWKPRWPAWKANWAGAAWKQVFSKVPCEESRDYTGRAKSLAQQHLRRDLQLGIARPIEHPADVRVDGGEPGQFLSGLGAEGTRRGGNGVAGCGATNGAGASDHGYRRITPLVQRAGFVVGRRR